MDNTLEEKIASHQRQIDGLRLSIRFLLGAVCVLAFLCTVLTVK